MSDFTEMIVDNKIEAAKFIDELLREKKSVKHAFASLLNLLWNSTILHCKEGYREEAWKELYDTIFSENVSITIFRLFPDFHYTDPDGSYYDDVTAFIRDFDEYSKGDEK